MGKKSWNQIGQNRLRISHLEIGFKIAFRRALGLSLSPRASAFARLLLQVGACAAHQLVQGYKCNISFLSVDSLIAQVETDSRFLYAFVSTFPFSKRQTKKTIKKSDLPIGRPLVSSIQNIIIATYHSLRVFIISRISSDAW